MKRLSVLLLIIIVGISCTKEVEINKTQSDREFKTDYEEYLTRADLRLPFDSTWYVFWGGRTVKENYHRQYRRQKYASDYTIKKKGVPYSGSKLNENHYCFGADLLAPAQGVIFAVENSIEDNNPVGILNTLQPLGNYVIIDHGNDEYSFLLHFKMNSIVVKAGQKVRKGQKLGECGNSGYSFEPHLHYHMQDSPIYLDGYGIPAQFQNFSSNGVFINRGEPLRGQYVKHKKSLFAGTAESALDK